MDNETLAYIKERVAAEADLPDGWAERLHGGTLAEMRDDAHRLRSTLGLDPEPTRTPDGCFAGSHDAMNDAIRSARGTTIPAALRDTEPADGTLGAGAAASTLHVNPT